MLKKKTEAEIDVLDACLSTAWWRVELLHVSWVATWDLNVGLGLFFERFWVVVWFLGGKMLGALAWQILQNLTLGRPLLVLCRLHLHLWNMLS